MVEKAGSSRETSFRWSGAGRGLPGEPILRPGGSPLPGEPGVHRAARDGTYIARQPVESSFAPRSVILTEKDDQMELFEMRRMIEPDLAYLAAERATEEEIAMMEKVLSLRRNDRPGDYETDVDRNFHYIMARAARNKALLRITDNIIDLLAESRDQYLQVEGRPQKSILRHREVLEAIRARDPERAEKCMLEHLVDIETSLFGISGRRSSKKGIANNLMERR
jgi:DNA-binding FadR family transcriptional regulator